MKCSARTLAFSRAASRAMSFIKKCGPRCHPGNPGRGVLSTKRRTAVFIQKRPRFRLFSILSGNIMNYVAVKRDITKEQELELQFLEAQKMEAIGTLAGGVAHDFNNILAVILANAEMLELSEERLSTESREILGQIMTASKRAKELVRQILQFSRRGRQEKIIMNLKPLVKETMGLLRSSLPTTIRIEPNIASDTGMILADPTQMQQVLMNLCTNAAHAMEEKGGV